MCHHREKSFINRSDTAASYTVTKVSSQIYSCPSSGLWTFSHSQHESWLNIVLRFSILLSTSHPAASEWSLGLVLAPPGTIYKINKKVWTFTTAAPWYQSGLRSPRRWAAVHWMTLDPDWCGDSWKQWWPTRARVSSSQKSCRVTETTQGRLEDRRSVFWTIIFICQKDWCLSWDVD